MAWWESGPLPDGLDEPRAGGDCGADDPADGAGGGVCVSLGSDTAGASGFLDMVRVMYVAACAHKDAYQDPELIGAYKALEMAKIDGARAWLWDGEIGSLEVGKRADLVLIDRAGI